jgi:hypothetical protein
VRLTIELPSSERPFTAAAEILRVDSRRTDRGAYYEAGCNFLDLSDHDRDLITRFVFRFQARPASSGA